jgi:flagellar basal body-associated protein FliL
VKLPRGKRAIVLVGLPVGLAVAAGLAATQLAAGGGAPPPVPDPSPGQHGAMLPLESRVINLPTGGPFRYAKIALTVELRPESAAFYELTGEARTAAEKEIVASAEPLLPLLYDAVGSVVAASSGSALATSEGRAALKADLLAAVRDVLGEEEVLGIYLTDLVMQ